jgi:hypothetical protein
MKRIVLITATTLSVVAVALFSTSCRKTTSCYDPALAERYRNAFCTADCPGVIGCNGKTYCNECEAARQGVRVK